MIVAVSSRPDDHHRCPRAGYCAGPRPWSRPLHVLADAVPGTRRCDGRVRGPAVPALSCRCTSTHPSGARHHLQRREPPLRHSGMLRSPSRRYRSSWRNRPGSTAARSSAGPAHLLPNSAPGLLSVGCSVSCWPGTTTSWPTSWSARNSIYTLPIGWRRSSSSTPPIGARSWLWRCSCWSLPVLLFMGGLALLPHRGHRWLGRRLRAPAGSPPEMTPPYHRKEVRMAKQLGVGFSAPAGDAGDPYAGYRFAR